MSEGWSFAPPDPAPAAHDGWSFTPDPATAAKTLFGPVQVTSTYRTPAHNAAVGGVPTSAHTTGHAVDFVPPANLSFADAEQKLRNSGQAFDQLIDEGDHWHVSFDPRARGQVFSTRSGRPTPPKAANAGWSFAAPPMAAPFPDMPVPGRVPAKPAAQPYNPVSEFGKRLSERAHAGWKALDEGGRQFAPGDGQSADPIEQVKGLAKQVGGLWDAGPGAAIGAAGDVVLGKPINTLSGGRIPEATSGDAMSAAAGFLAPGGAHGAAPGVAEAEALTNAGQAARNIVRRVRGKPAAEAKGWTFEAPHEAEPVTPPAEAPAAAADWTFEAPAKPATVVNRAAKFDEPAPPVEAPAPLGERPAIEPAEPVSAPPEQPATASIEQSATAAPADAWTFEAPEPAARPRAMAEAPGSNGREIFSTGGADDVGGPVVGGETNPVERVDNAIYRLGNHATADKIEAQQFLKSLPESITNPATQEELYHAIEGKLVDPNATIPEHLQPAMDAMRPHYEEQTDIINDLRAMGDPDIEDYLHDQGYVARRVEGYTPMLDNVPGEQVRDPILGQGKTLTQTAQAQKQRTAGFVTTDQAGNSHFWPGEAPVADVHGQPYASVRPATTAEIEANTGLRYHKNALLNTVDNVLRLRRVLRNREVLEELKRNLADEGLAHRDYWYRRNEAGELVKQFGNSRAPDGYRAVSHIPQLDGMSFAPHIAETLEDAYPKHTPGDLGDKLTKVNRALTASLFITPIPHAANVMSHWAVGRGFDWIRPTGYRNLAKTGIAAAREVLTLGPKYREMLRHGSGLLYGDTQVANFHKLMFEKAGREILGDPKAVNVLAKAAGMPVAAVKKAYQLASKSLWMANDVFLLQRQMELEAKGLSTRKAIHEAERDIPNYRVPPRVLGSRAASQWLRNPNIMLFGRYKYGQLRAWGTMFHDMARGTGPQRTEAFGKFLAAVVIANVVYPAADKALQALTGNKDAKVKRAGGLSLTDTAADMATGKKGLQDGVSSFMSPAPLWSKGQELVFTNHDHFGNKIRSEGAPAWYQGAQVGKYVGTNAAYPVQLGAEAFNPGGVPAVAGKLVGVDIPPPNREAKKAKWDAIDKAKGLKETGRFKARLASGDYGAAISKMGRK